MGKSLKIIASAIYVAVLGELFVRLVAPQAIMPRYVTAADYGIRTNIPNSTYRHHTLDADVEFRINSAGFRADREYTLRKPTDACRIVMLGDSFMVGYEVDVDDSIPYLVERQLRSNGARCEVINMGVSGFGTAEMVVALEQRALAYDPDVVVFQWHSTDYNDNVRSDLFKLDGNRLVRDAERYLPAIAIRDALQAIPAYRFVADHSELYNAVRERAAVQIKQLLAELRHQDSDGGERRDEGGAAAPRNKQRKPYNVRLSAQLLHFARELATAHGARFYLLDIPQEREDGTVRSGLYRFDEDQLDGIDIVRYDRRFNRLLDGGADLYYAHGQGHFTPLGYAIAAQELTARLLNDRTTRLTLADSTEDDEVFP